MSTKKEWVQSILTSALKGPRFAASNIKITSNLDNPSVGADGIITYEGAVLCFDYEWKLTVEQKGEDHLKSVKLEIESRSPLATGISVIDQFLTEEEGIEGAEPFIKSLFPKNFPFEAGVTVKELELGFVPQNDQDILESIGVKFGTFKAWKILDTDNFDLTGIDVIIKNDNIKEGKKNLFVGISASTILGEDGEETEEEGHEPVTLEFSFGSTVLDGREAFKENMEIAAELKNAPISIVPMMKGILSEEHFNTWNTLTPEAFKGLRFDTYKFIISPFKHDGKGELHVVQDTGNPDDGSTDTDDGNTVVDTEMGDLGGMEIILKPTELALSGLEEAKYQKNILLALTPPNNNTGTFFKSIDDKLRDLDQLNLSGSGLIFSTYEDTAEVHLANLKQYADGEETLKVKGGLELFAQVKMRSDVKEEEIIQNLLEQPGEEEAQFFLHGSISKDFKSYELELDFKFKDAYLVQKDVSAGGDNNRFDEGEVKLHRIAIAFIMHYTPPSSYVGFRILGEVDARIKDALLRFTAGLTVTAGGTPPSVTFLGEFGLAALNPPPPDLNNDMDPEDAELEPPVWRNAFGVKGLGIRYLWTELGFDAPPLQPSKFSFKGNLLLGSVIGEEIGGSIELAVDKKKPSSTKMNFNLANITIIDIIEAFDDQKNFNLQGPIRDLLTLGVDVLGVAISPAPPDPTFSFDVKGLNLGILNADCSFTFGKDEISASGSIAPIIIETGDLQIFALHGTSGPESNAQIALQLSPNAPRFEVDGMVTILGGAGRSGQQAPQANGALVKGGAKVLITHEEVDIQAAVSLFGGVYTASVDLKSNSFISGAPGMYLKVRVQDDVLETISNALKAQLQKNYEKDRENIEAAQAQLNDMRGKNSFLDPVSGLSSEALEGIKRLQDAGKSVGFLLIQLMENAFNFDYIKFEGDLNTMNNKTIEAEVQLTIAGHTINEKIKINFAKEEDPNDPFAAFADLVAELEPKLLEAFNFLGEEFTKLVDTLETVGQLFEEGAAKISAFTDNTVSTVGRALDDLLKFLKTIAEATEGALDEFFNGQKVVPAEAGGPISFTPEIEHYRVTLDRIKVNAIQDPFESFIVGPRTLEIYGYCFLEPVGSSMRLGRPGGKGNRVAFSRRRGDILKMAVDDFEIISHTKYFYYNKGRTNQNPTIFFRTALREAGVAIETDEQFTFNRGHESVNLNEVVWSQEPEIKDDILSYNRITRKSILQIKRAENVSEIELQFTIDKLKTFDETSLKKVIKNEKTEEITRAFEHGADPSFGGLMEAALSSSEKVEDKIDALLHNQVIPETSDLDFVTKGTFENRYIREIWYRFKKLMDNGAKPTATHIQKVLEAPLESETTNYVRTILQHEVKLTAENLTKALETNNYNLANLLLDYNPPINENHLTSAFGTHDSQLKLVEKILIKANKQSKEAGSLGEPVITRNVLYRAVAKNYLKILDHLLKTPILDQSVFQLALREACILNNDTLGDRHQAFNNLLAAGARVINVAQQSEVESPVDILKALYQSIDQLTVRDNGLDMLERLLERGADANYALQLAIEHKNRRAIDICLANQAQPDKAIVFAIEQGDADLMLNILPKAGPNTTGLAKSRANFALQQTVLKTIVNPLSNDQLPTLAGVALDAGADPNGSFVVPQNDVAPLLTDQDISFLIFLGQVKRYDMVYELITDDLNTYRLPVNAVPSIFQAIKNRDPELLSVINNGRRDFGDDRYLETAVDLMVAHPLVESLIRAGASVSTKALETTLKKEDYDTAKLLIEAGALGNSEMLNILISADKKELLQLLRSNTLPAADNFQLAAVLNRTDYFEILADTNGRLSEVAPLFAAIEKHNSAILKKGLEIGAPATEALKFAIEQKWEEGILTSLECGAVPTSAVSYAANHSSGELLKTILKNHNGDPQQALAESLEKQLKSNVDIAIANGANVNLPIASSADRNHATSVKWLVEAGAQPDLAMMGMIRHEDVEMVKYLLEKGADGSKPWYLEEAIERRNAEIIMLLLDSGADAKEGLNRAISTGQTELVKMLLQAGADGTDPTLMDNAVARSLPEIIGLLARSGADVNTPRPDGHSWLHQASGKEGDHATVKALLEAGAKPGAINDAGDQPLHVATPLGDGNLETTKLLVEAGADVNAKNADGKRVLFVVRGEQVRAYMLSQGAGWRGDP